MRMELLLRMKVLSRGPANFSQCDAADIFQLSFFSFFNDECHAD